MFATWNEAKVFFDNIHDSIVKESKRVLKKDIPKSIAIREEVINNLITHYNDYISNLVLHWHEFDENQIYLLKNTYSKVRDKVIRSFQVLDVAIKVPISCHEFIDKNIKELDFLDIPKVDIEQISDKMAMNKADFFNLASKILSTEFDGSPDRLLSFIDALSLLQLNSTGNEDNAVAYVKTRLVGKARDLITDQNSLPDIISKLRTGIKTEDSQYVEAQLYSIKQNGRELTKFAAEMDSLSSRLKRAYINEGIPAEVAEKFTTKNVVKALIKNSNSDRVKIIMEASVFPSGNDAIAKFVNVNSEMPTTSILYSRNQNSWHRPRGRGYHRSPNSGRNTFNHNSFQSTSRNFQNFNQSRGRYSEGRRFLNNRFSRGSNHQNNRNVRMYESAINNSENHSSLQAGPLERD